MSILKEIPEQPMTRQQIFDHVVEHAREMPEKCQVDGTRQSALQCVYRDGKGNACFVGSLIPEERYTPEIEGGSLHDQSLALDALEGVIELSDQPFLKELQIIHDCSIPPLWDEKFAIFAEEYNLTFTPL